MGNVTGENMATQHMSGQLGENGHYAVVDAPAPLPQESSTLAQLDTVWKALAEARSDFERLQVRDHARAIQVAAGILQRREVQVEASLLVADAERAIAKANPPSQGKRNDFVLDKHEVDGQDVRNFRRAHAHIPDQEWEEFKQEAREEQEPVTRSALIRKGQEKRNPHIAQASGNEQWNTPGYILERVRQVFAGAIDCDPASTELANEGVGATVYYTEQDNGLVQDWPGRVYVNPPYSSGLIDKFAEKLLAEIDAGNTQQCIWLSNNSTDTKWCQLLLHRADVFCLTDHRVRFERPETGQAGSPLQGQVVIGFGVDVADFMAAFADMGAVAVSASAAVRTAQDVF